MAGFAVSVLDTYPKKSPASLCLCMSSSATFQAQENRRMVRSACLHPCWEQCLGRPQPYGNLWVVGKEKVPFCCALQRGQGRAGVRARCVAGAGAPSSGIRPLLHGYVMPRVVKSLSKVNALFTSVVTGQGVMALSRR